MSLVIEPYQPEHETAVNDFNRRLQAGGAEPDLVFYRYAVPRWLPPDGSSIYNQYFVAVENGQVRGGYALKWQEFLFPDGSVRSIGYYHHPLSEGIVNKAYAIVGMLLLRDAMQRSPLLYCLGMGGYDRPLPKMLIGLGWSHFLVPFYFRVLHPYRFLRQMQTLRSSWARRWAADAAALTGAGWVTWAVHRAAVRLKAPAVSEYPAERIPEFSNWADALWEEVKNSCTLTAMRDSKALRRLYPASQEQFTKLRISEAGKDIGWAVVGERRKDQKYGSLRVGSIVDCWALPNHTNSVIRSADSALQDLGMDLIVSNQSHQDWCSALETAGFLKAQSNFIFAASKKLAELLQPFQQTRSHFHFTRADGDGLPGNF